MTAFSLLTYNIHKGYNFSKRRFLLPEMKVAIEKLSPDLVFLQEVQGQHIKKEKKHVLWPKVTQSDYIAESLWPYVIYAKNATYQAGHHGNAILSKVKFSRYENINVSSWARASRAILHTVIEIDNVDVHLVCVHLGLFKDEREKQVNTLATRITEHVPQTAPLILAGDFNDWRVDLFQALERNLGLSEAIKESHGGHAKSFPAIKPTLQVDRIYYRGLKLEFAHCLSDKPWKSLSDHLPLYAQFSL